jgi:D-alanyl-lipoteichoic acid acyltransferase DltB (MBOAT superfamily)
MLFNSLDFLFFFGLLYFFYLCLPFRGQNTLLLLAGYIFYGWWDVRFLFLIAFSTTVDFWIGLMLAEGRVQKQQRLVSSSFIVLAAILFLMVDWHVLIDWPREGFRLPFYFGDHTTLAGLAASLIFVVLTNTMHDRVAQMEAKLRRKLMLFVTVFVNLTFLGIFKYFNFFIDSASDGLEAFGWDATNLHLHILLPVGISFYTFQSLSYTIDVSRGLIKPTRRLQDFALFVAYFPPMVAGPIERARHLLPQLLSPRKIRLKQFSQGLFLILLGLFKKIGIADGIAVAVNVVFNATGAVSASDICLATVLFAVQIYCDFSGYTDIARGVSKLLGIELMLNFNLPYFSKNPSDFWRRWHISLSSWLRDYLYIGLGGNRKGELRTYINLMATMVLGGLWHGAAWNFVLWGGYQGLLLCVHRLFLGLYKKRTFSLFPEQNKITNALKIIFFFGFICYGWLLFRATSFHQIIGFSKSIFGFGTIGVPSIIPRPPIGALLGIGVLTVMQFMEYIDGRLDVIRYWPRIFQGATFAMLFVILLMGTSNAPMQFIYFQF